MIMNKRTPVPGYRLLPRPRTKLIKTIIMIHPVALLEGLEVQISYLTTILAEEGSPPPKNEKKAYFKTFFF